MSRKKIVCLGDSITWGWPYGQQASWVRMLQESVDADFINQGIPGNTMGDMLDRFERHVLKHNPTHVIIMGGGNDVMIGESRDRITWNIERMAEMAEANGIQVIFGLTPPIDFKSQEKLLVRIRDWIKEYAAARGLAVIDFQPAFYDESGALRSDTLLPDGAHPTETGYQEMYRQIDLDLFRPEE